MPSTQPHLAPWERRLVACLLDASLLLVVALALYGATFEVGWSTEQVLFVLGLVHIAYQAVTALEPKYALGRTVAGVLLLSTGEDGSLKVWQAVVRPSIRVLALFAFGAFGSVVLQDWLFATPIAVELALMAHTPWRQSVADRVARTIVVRKPPLQPHRAPAYPMFSAKNEEFGPKP